MKNYLLILTVALSVTANAQTTRKISTSNIATPTNKTMVYSELNQPTSIPAIKAQLRHGSPVNHSNGHTVNTIQIGQAGNAYGPAFGPHSNLWYDQDINTVSFTHRSDPLQVSKAWKNNGFVLYDYSINGGATWSPSSLNAGPAYDNSANPLGGGGARYPNGVIYNPIGNTNPANAYQTVYGPITDGTGWSNHYRGTTQLGSATNMQGLYPTTNGIKALIPSSLQIVKNTRTIWASTMGYITDYDDSIVLSKGTFSGGDVNYTFSSFYAPVGLNGTAKVYAAHAMAFNDAGTIGYVAIIGNDENPLVDSIYYLMVYKTSDGGNTWSKVADRGNINLDNLDTLFNNPGISCTTAFDLDCAVDKNDNLHIAVEVGLYPAAFSIASAPGTFGVFDIYTNDGGGKWYGELLCLPETFRGSFSTLAEDGRMQASRSWDGSKMSFTWFDTDTIQFPGSGNIFPDMFARGVDVNTNMWTSPCTNLTVGSAAEAFCTFGNVSYYSITNGSDECIPVVYGQLADPNQPDVTLGFYYIDQACVSGYTTPGEPKYLGTTGIAENPALKGLSVSANYPNPFNGSTSFDVTLTKPLNVMVEVSNIVGQVLSTITYKNLNTGKNQLTIDASNFAAGLYIYKVKAGNEIVTRTMTVK